MAPESSSHGLFGAVLDIAAEDTGAAKHSQWCACSRSSLPRPSGRSGYRLLPEEKPTLSSLALYNRANCVLSRVSESYAGEIAIDCSIVVCELLLSAANHPSCEIQFVSRSCCTCCTMCTNCAPRFASCKADRDVGREPVACVHYIHGLKARKVYYSRIFLPHCISGTVQFSVLEGG
jgi:hypothetical protein